MNERKDCADCGPQMVWEFYVNHHNSDDLSTYCKACTKRRSAVAQTKRRDKRRNQGMPVSDKSYNEHLTHGNGYLERHLQRREQEAARCLSEPSPDESQGSLQPDPHAWVGLMDGWLRPQTKVYQWSVK